MFSAEQLRVIAGILADLGQVSVASIVIPFVIPRFAADAVPTIVLGSSLALFFWTLSIFSARAIENL